MAESVGSSNNVLSRIKGYFGDNYCGVEGDKTQHMDLVKQKLHKQLSRSRSGRIKHRPRHYSSVSEIQYFPPTLEEEKSENFVENVNNENRFQPTLCADKSKPSSEFFKDVNANEITMCKEQNMKFNYKF